jgi:hypothetical protein
MHSKMPPAGLLHEAGDESNTIMNPAPDAIDVVDIDTQGRTTWSNTGSGSLLLDHIICRDSLGEAGNMGHSGVAKVERPGPSHGQTCKAHMSAFAGLNGAQAPASFAPNLSDAKIGKIVFLWNGEPAGKLWSVKLVERVVDVCGRGVHTDLCNFSNTLEHIFEIGIGGRLWVQELLV